MDDELADGAHPESEDALFEYLFGDDEDVVVALDRQPDRTGAPSA